MHHRQSTHNVSQKKGSISSILDQNIIESVNDDGGNYVNYKEIEPSNHMPGGFNAEMQLNLTTPDYHVTQFDESFINKMIDAALQFSDILFNPNLGAVGIELQKGMFLFVEVKNSVELIRSYQFEHNGKTIANAFQSDATIESALMHMCSDRVTKNN